MRRPVGAVAVLVLAALLVFGALDGQERRSWAAGLLDPLIGLDHFMVLVGIGLWAGRLGAPAPRRMLAAFLVGALAGFVLAAGQPSALLVEALVRLLVIGSVLLVGVGLMVRVSLPQRDATSMAAMIGGCHGYLHRLEVGPAEALWFGLGAVVTAGALMTVGVAVATRDPRTG